MEQHEQVEALRVFERKRASAAPFATIFSKMQVLLADRNRLQ